MAAGLVIETAVQHKEIMYKVLGDGLLREIDVKRGEQLRELCRHLDARSPDLYITMPLVVAHALEQSLNQQRKLVRTIDMLFE